MKILFTLDTLRGGGTETSLLHLIHHFSDASQCTVCYFYPPHDLKAAYSKAPCSFGVFEFKGSVFFLSRDSTIKKIGANKKSMM